jgi:hypothetical protein
MTMILSFYVNEVMVNVMMKMNQMKMMRNYLNHH